MKKNKAIFYCVLLAGCSGTGTGDRHPHAADLHLNATVLGQYCSACHAAPSPRLHSKAEWPSVVSRMDMHRMEARMPALTTKEHQSVLAYLESHAAN